MKHDIFIGCDCTELGHVICLTYWDDEWGDSLYLQYHLEKQPFFKRVKAAVKHIFGRRSKFGEFGELCLPEKEVQKLYSFTLDYLMVQEKLNTKRVERKNFDPSR